METWFELWNYETYTFVAIFGSKEQALAHVKQEIVTYGSESIVWWGLFQSEKGQLTLVAEWPELLILARSLTAH